MTKKDDFIFKGLHIISWIIFVGLGIEAGGLIVNFVVSIIRPDLLPYLYQKLDITAIYNRSEWVFYSAYSFILAIALLKAYLFYVVILLTIKFDMVKPFQPKVADRILKISSITLLIGLLSYFARQISKIFMHHGYDLSALNGFWGDGQAFILMAAVIYIIAKIFSRGLEIQNENDLTV